MKEQSDLMRADASTSREAKSPELAKLLQEYQSNRIDPSLPHQIGQLYAAEGDTDRALRFLRVVRRDYRPYLPNYLPLVEALRLSAEKEEALEVIAEGLSEAQKAGDNVVLERLSALHQEVAI